MEQGNPYIGEIERVLPRLLALYDDAPASPTYGFGDRLHWAWKLTDFANGTFQGAAHGLAILSRSSLIDAIYKRQRLLARIDAMFHAAKQLTRRDGSLEEAFPYEASYCVTALVAYDLLSAILTLGKDGEASRFDEYVAVVRPMIGFLQRTEETHGFISNHLATAAAALVKWALVTGERTEEPARQLVESILASGSSEGWFREYEGADPGYQTLCMGYLADIHLLRPEWNLEEPLRRGFRFLGHFAHPDGSFGGHYGSRNTRIYFPSGAELLAPAMPEAASLAAAMRGSIRGRKTVVLSAMDESNLIPMFNSYCRAAASFDASARANRTVSPAPLPAFRSEVLRVAFPEAGLLIDRGPSHYTVVSWRKGGVCYHFRNGRASTEDLGVVMRDRRDRHYSSQSDDPDVGFSIEPDRLIVHPRLTRARQMVPTPLRFIILRVLCVTAFRIPALSRTLKRLLVRLLITGKEALPVRMTRTIHLGADLVIHDEPADFSAYGLEPCNSRRFSAIHMASQGYWQAGDDRP